MSREEFDLELGHAFDALRLYFKGLGIVRTADLDLG